MMMLTNLTSNNKFIVWCIQCLIFISLLSFLLISSPLTINANLTSLFSQSTDETWQTAQQKINAGANTKQLYLIGHKDLSVAAKAVAAFVTQARKIDGIDHVVGKLDVIPDQSMMIDSYKGFEQQLLSEPFKEALLSGDDNRVFQLQFDLINQIGDQLVAKTFATDSSLSFANYLNRSPFPQNKIVLSNDGYLTLTYQNITYILVTLSTSEGALNVNVAKSIVASLDNISLIDNVDYVRTGAIFYSDEASRTAQSEMQWLGGLSIVATLLLIFLSYRRFSIILVTFTLIAISGLYGLLGLNLFFKEVNILTMIFAITLVGIAVDYSFHSFTELQYRDRKERSPLSSIKMSLILSFLTTTLGYTLLVVVPIELFKQIAVFTIFGLFGALTTVLLLYPYLHQKFDFSREKSPALYKKVNDSHQRLLSTIRPHVLAPILLTTFTIVTLLNVIFVSFSDNPKTFYQVSSTLESNESRVKSILGQKFDNQYLLVKGESIQAVLEHEELILPTLNSLVKTGVIGSYQAISSWLPSIKKQQTNNELLVAAADSGKFAKLAQITGLSEIKVQQATVFLTPKMWFETSLGKSFKHLIIEDQRNAYSVIRFSSITDVKALSSVLSSLDSATFVDTLADAERDLSEFRQVLLIVFAVAFGVAFVVFTVRYGWVMALSGVLVPVIAFSIAILVSSLIQNNINLFNVAAGLVILALGLDYSVFYAEHGFSESITQTTLMSALSSIFVFAMLGFSSTPAIAHFGQTVFIGIILTFLCSPIITYLSKKRGQDD